MMMLPGWEPRRPLAPPMPSILLIPLLLAVLTVAVSASCTPSARRELAPLVVPLERAGCVLLRHETGEVCATADELAPFLAELLQARRDEPQDAGSAVIAFALTAPRHPHPRRRCVAWVPTVSLDAGPVDAGH